MTKDKVIKHLEKAYDALLDAQFEIFDKPEFKEERFKMVDIQTSISRLQKQIKGEGEGHDSAIVKDSMKLTLNGLHK